jgi:peptidyl-prolyl cis-trans isomerase D
MAKAGSSTTSRIFVWGILILLIAALAGFGANSLGGTIRSIGSVGDTEISVNDYARALQNELNIQSQRRGAPYTLLQATQDGVDQRIRAQLAGQAALTEEARVMGLSVGDTEVAQQLNTIPQFQGVDGTFDREGYEFMLRQNGLTTGEFEEGLRDTAARNLLQQAVTGGTVAQPTFAETLYLFLSEKRSFRWAVLDDSLLVTPAVEPTEAELQTFFDANTEQFLTPEIRKATYVWLTPDMLLDSIDVDEAELKLLYDERADAYIRPERRLIERLSFADMAEAEAAKAALDAGETTFDTLVTDRDLTLDDVDQGEVARGDLDSAIADVVFALTEPGISAPVETSLGPALYRINAVLEASTTSFEDVREELLAESSADRARREIEDQIIAIDDLLVGGATLEDVAAETEMQLGKVDFSPELSEGIAGYDEFRAEISRATLEDFAQITELSDGGIFALRLEEIVAPATPPLADVKDDVTQAFKADLTVKRLAEMGENMKAQLESGTDMEALGLTPTTETDVARGTFFEGAPQQMIVDVFEAPEGGTVLVEGSGTMALVELIDISPPDLEAEEAQAFLGQLTQVASQTMSADIFQLFGQAVQTRHGISLNQAAINAVHAQY